MIRPNQVMDSKLIFPMEELINGLSTQISKLQLIPFQSGSWVAFLRKNFDFFFHGEPFICLSVFVHLQSGQLIVRVLGRTVLRANCLSIVDIGELLVRYFEQSTPCLGQNGPGAFPIHSTDCLLLCSEPNKAGFSICSQCQIVGAGSCQNPADLCKTELEEDFHSLLNEVPSDLEEIKSNELETVGTDRDDYSDEEEDLPMKDQKGRQESSKSGYESLTKNGESKKVFKCHECDKIYKAYVSLHRHNVRHHGHGKFCCISCDVKCSSISAIFEHVNEEHSENPKLRCASCQQKFDLQTKSDFEAHYSECVLENFNKKASAFREKYKTKKSTTSWKSHQCDLCGDTFSTNFLLKNHRIQKHTKDFPYKCEDCDYGTVWKQGYEMHRKTHLRDKGFLENESKDALWFFCEKCGNKFSTKDTLKYHVLKVHEKIKERLECKDCEKVFANRVRLSRHRIIEHSTDPKYQCEICGYRGTGTDLKIHKKTHEAPQFKCKYCGKGIKSQTSLICHERIHTGENPFKCPFCEYTCKSSATLCLHKKFIHNDGKNLTEHPLPDAVPDT